MHWWGEGGTAFQFSCLRIPRYPAGKWIKIASVNQVCSVTLFTTEHINMMKTRCARGKLLPIIRNLALILFLIKSCLPIKCSPCLTVIRLSLFPTYFITIILTVNHNLTKGKERFPKTRKDVVKLKSASGQVPHKAGAYPGFRCMKRLGVFLFSPGWNAIP